MSLVRRLARPLLAATFVSAGIDAFLHPMNRADRARSLTERISTPQGPADPELLVRANGALQAGAGMLLALGRAPRFAALALVASAVPSTYLDHPFWEQTDPERRRDERALFLRNLGLIGGVMLAAVDTEGRPGLAWRGRHLTAHATDAVRDTLRETVQEAAQAVKAVPAGADAVRSRGRRAVGALPGVAWDN